MLDDTSLSGTCDLQKRRRIMPQRQHHLHFRAKERFAQAPATCDWTLRVASPGPGVFYVRATDPCTKATHVPLRASSFMLYRPRSRPEQAGRGVAAPVSRAE